MAPKLEATVLEGPSIQRVRLFSVNEHEVDLPSKSVDHCNKLVEPVDEWRSGAAAEIDHHGTPLFWRSPSSDMR